MVYSERTATSKIIILLLLFPILYLTNLAVTELSSQEALYASIAKNIAAGETLLRTQVHGEPVQSFPGYPWLVALSSGFQRPNEWTTRFPAAVAILGIALLAAALTASQAGKTGGLVAGIMVLTTLFSMRDGVNAASDALFAFFISSAWISWYWFGREKHHWGLAWTVALSLVLAATFTAGVKSFAYFYFPIILLRRPLQGWRRMLLPVHGLLLIVVVAVLVLWHLQVPERTLMPWNTLVLRSVESTTGSYLRNLILFPFAFAIMLLPWIFLAWPAFCQAYQPLEKNKPLFHFLRTVVISLFVGAWLLPLVSYRALLPLIGPLAVLTGMHYQFLMRRMSTAVEKFYRILFWLSAIVVSVFLFFGLLHLARIVVLADFDFTFYAFNMVLLLLAALALKILHKKDRNWEFWLRFAVLLAAARLAYLAVVPPMQAWLHSENRIIGNVLQQDVPPERTVYKTVDWLIVSETFYMNRKIVKVNNLEEDIPKDTVVVYVLGGAKPPIMPSRTWEPVSPPVDLRTQSTVTREWFSGGITLLRLTPVMNTVTTEPSVVVRVYEGTLR